MDSKLKLTRTTSSLLRSSPTLRSSVHSLSSFVEAEDVEDEKRKDSITAATHRIGSIRVAANVAAVLSPVTIFAFFFCRRDQPQVSENLLLALIIVAAALSFTLGNQRTIRHILFVIKNQLSEINARLGLCLGSSKRTEPVQWFIGDTEENIKNDDVLPDASEMGEGVEFYSNGDFYEGEFHNGKCNGSGVFNYFAKGRYEGDWVDGKYDGFGIESWARGSRYRGQYRSGLRHGHGVYRFYTGDSYAGEWWNGQSHGAGVQSCGDGSSYIGEFKFGIKHGLGCYHFRYLNFFKSLFLEYCLILI